MKALLTMSIELYLAFLAATIILLIIPGPTITLIVTTAIYRGQTAAMAMVPGVFFGDLVAASLSLMGVGAILSASAALFTLLKWCGALYLIYLGVAMWRQKPEDTAFEEPSRKDKSRLSQTAFLVTVLNPKSILFFIAFLPQFINPAHAAWPQLILLGATFVILGGLNAAAYAWAAGRSAGLFSTRARLWMQRTGGTCLIGAGALALATTKD